MDVIFEFMVGVEVVVIDAEFEFALLGVEHHGLAVHAAHHVEGCGGAAPQGHFQHVVADPLLEGLAQLVLDLEKAVRRTEAAEALMGTLVVVILDPEADPGAGGLEVVELGAAEEFAPDGAPEPLDLAQRHRVMGLGTDVGDAVLGQFHLEARLAAPGRVLAAVVGEHLLGGPVLRDRPAIDLDDRMGGLAAEQFEAGDETRVIVHEGDQVRVGPAQPEAEDVALPHLVGGGPLEKPGLARVAFGPLGRRVHQFLPVQRPPHGFGADLHQEPAVHHLGDAPHAPTAVGPLQLDDLLTDGGGQARSFIAAAGRRRR